MGKAKTCLGTAAIAVVGVGVQVYLTLKNPPMQITLERQSSETEIREGRVYNSFLLDRDNWEPGPGYTAVGLENTDLPVPMGAPQLFRLTDEALKAECPSLDLDDEYLGGYEAARDLLTRTSRVYVNDFTRGSNVIGCVKSTYQSPDEAMNSSMDLDRLGLHFDGEYHKDEKSATASHQKKGVRTVSTFFSNFSNFRNTAPLHATMVASKVVQCTGTKTWMFFEPDCCNDWGHHVYNGATLAKGFGPDTKFKVVTTRRGDVMTFGPFQHHVVWTWPGPSFMQTHRLFSPKVILKGLKQFGFSYLQALRDARRNNKGSQPANQAAASNGAIDMRAMYCDNQMDEATRLKFMAELKSFDPELPDAGA
jgi:hypothetical protein